MPPVYRFLLWVGLCMLGACRKNIDILSAPPPAPGSGTSVPLAKTYLALGDSYTIGQNVAVNERFPSQVRNWLINQGINLEAPQIIATTGWTTDNLSDAITAQNPQGPYSVVSLLIGVNDQFQYHDTTGYRTKFLRLLNTAIRLTGGSHASVVVVSIPDYSVTPFARYFDTAMIRKQIGWFNQINREETFRNACQYVDVTPLSRQAATDKTLLTDDSLHPSGIEYGKWVDVLGPVMKTALR